MENWDILSSNFAEPSIDSPTDMSDRWLDFVKIVELCTPYIRQHCKEPEKLAWLPYVLRPYGLEVDLADVAAVNGVKYSTLRSAHSRVLQKARSICQRHLA